MAQENPFLRAPLDVGETPSRALMPQADHVRTFLERTGLAGTPGIQRFILSQDDSTARDGVNLAINRFTGSNRQPDSAGKSYFLIADGTGTGKGFQAVLSGAILGERLNQDALLVTRADLVDEARNDATRLGLNDCKLRFTCFEEFAKVLSDAKRTGTQFSVVAIDEAQELRSEKLQALLETAPTRNVLLLSATPVQSRAEAEFFGAKLSGRSRAEVRRQLASGDAAERVAEIWRDLYRNGACVRREFPFYGEQGKLELETLSIAQREEEQAVLRGYEAQMKFQALPEVRRLKLELAQELRAISDLALVHRATDEIERRLRDGGKVIFYGDDKSFQSSFLRDTKGEPRRFAGLLSAVQQELAFRGVTATKLLEPLPPPIYETQGEAIARARANHQLELQNRERMARFVDGVVLFDKDGLPHEVKHPSGDQAYKSSQVKVILLPHSQNAGYSVLNQRWPDADPVSIIGTLPPSANVKIQEDGRASRRNSEGASESLTLATDSIADTRQIQSLELQFKILRAVGVRAATPYLDLIARFEHLTRAQSAQPPRVISAANVPARRNSVLAGRQVAQARLGSRQ